MREVVGDSFRQNKNRAAEVLPANIITVAFADFCVAKKEPVFGPALKIIFVDCG